MIPTSFIGKTVTVKMDRPMGSRHPKHGFLYPINYGYVPGIIGEDGDELDAYVLGFFEPLGEFTGRCIAIIHRTNDRDDKLVIAPEGMHFLSSQSAPAQASRRGSLILS
jgi:inorganic pyrophosphatase